MVTGPGAAERSILLGNPRVLSIAQFWHRAAQHELIAADRVAVIGGSGIGTMLDELFRHRRFDDHGDLRRQVTAVHPRRGGILRERAG